MYWIATAAASAGGTPAQLLLPEGFALPPVPHLVALLLGLALVGVGLYRRDPPVDARVVLGFAPWMAVGSGLHVLYVLGSLPPSVAPFGGTPAVYLTVGASAGAVWLAADRLAERSPGRRRDATGRVSLVVGVSGAALLAVAVGIAASAGASAGTLDPLWPAIGLLVTVPVAAVAWMALIRIAPGVERAGAVGVLVMFAHALDGVSTTIGVEVLGYGERTPFSQLILDLGAALPTAEVVGAGWLFVVVKLAVAGLVVSLFEDYLAEDPGEALLLLGFVAAVGLGPGVHNLLLFAVAGG
ncbi:MAG: DUF63 family protein [Haloferacaceae archaeon]